MGQILLQNREKCVFFDIEHIFAVRFVRLQQDISCVCKWGSVFLPAAIELHTHRLHRYCTLGDVKKRVISPLKGIL
jgi:hypothetical protein